MEIGEDKPQVNHVKLIKIVKTDFFCLGLSFHFK